MALVSTGSREQLQLIHWEQFIASDNPVRVINAFVDLLDLEQLGFTIKGKSREGRPAFCSSTLLKRYFYGYLNRCRSSRQLMRAAQRNVELFWLLREAKPCYKTIADFRKDNTTALKKTFSALNQCFLSLLGHFLFFNIPKQAGFFYPKTSAPTGQVWAVGGCPEAGDGESWRFFHGLPFCPSKKKKGQFNQ